MKKSFISLMVVFCFLLLVSSLSAGVVPITKTYPDVTVSGGFSSGNFMDQWDLTRGPLKIHFTVDLNGIDDSSGAHAWAEFGIRALGYGNFNPTWMAEGAGVWLATDYDSTPNTFDPDPVGFPILDLDDKLILQKAGGMGEGAYDLPSIPPNPGANHRIWFDRDGVDQWQNPDTAKTGGVYNIVLTLTATSPTTATAYMNINELDQGFETDGNWNTIELTPAGMTFSGDMEHMQVFYGLYGYGATHSATFKNIVVEGFGTTPDKLKQLALDKLASHVGDSDKKIADRIQKAVEHIQKSLSAMYWETDGTLNFRGKKVFDEEKKAVEELMKVLKEKDANQAVKSDVTAAIDYLLMADKNLAQDAIDQAIEGEGDIKEIKKAQEEMAKALKEIGKDKAIEHYKNAWHHAQKALGKIIEE